ncbi:hypothetical protein F0919_03855 [Taibaiella lutea]|uniref:Uncharacterized protein n=1 Tax=Taibaiella lutea TaxID=2608001 RepID=A0A5M6CUX8_9BACT|nr:hypothetical protein [Taibaiella lutea]KAA5536815.1 hypothetical protein F0919_03855 [Taibaiella lutea]
MEKIIRAPMLRLLVFGAVVIIFIGWIVISKIHGSKTEQNFYEQSFKTTVVSSNSYYNRSIEFHLKNGLKLYFMPSDKNGIEIGDSIGKKGKTYLYDVYRKSDNGQYKFWATYNFEESL